MRPSGPSVGPVSGPGGGGAGAAGPGGRYRIVLQFGPELAFFLGSRHRDGRVEVRYDTTSSLGHVVESLGVPLPEVGDLLIGEHRAGASERIPPGQPVTVRAVARPQPLPTLPPRFCLDVHLGALARRLRLLGLDTTYRNDASDDELITEAAAGNMMLLTQDRGLLRRRAVRAGAYVRGSNPDAQLYDVLDRFAPPLAPWTRCAACNGLLAPAAKHHVEHLLKPGTRRTYADFAQCRSCGRVYWRGAHARRLDALIGNAARVAARRAATASADGQGPAPSGTPAR